jgi:hypothetical protein
MKLFKLRQDDGAEITIDISKISCVVIPSALSSAQHALVCMAGANSQISPDNARKLVAFMETQAELVASTSDLNKTFLGN